MNKILTQTGFDKMLALLDADREQAGTKYESLRTRLIKLFEWRNCENSQDLADIVLDRLIKKIAAGEKVENVNAYSVTVAQYVLKEEYRRRDRFFESIDEVPETRFLKRPDESDQPDGTDSQMICLQRCLAELSAENRQLIVAYYDANDGVMIDARKRLAASISVSLNILRIRVCRLKAKLESCTFRCCSAA